MIICDKFFIIKMDNPYYQTIKCNLKSILRDHNDEYYNIHMHTSRPIVFV